MLVWFLSHSRAARRAAAVRSGKLFLQQSASVACVCVINFPVFLKPHRYPKAVFTYF